MNFPNIYVSESDKNAKDKAWYKQYIDAAVSYFIATSYNRKKYERLYDSYNGMRDKNFRAMAYLTNLYGAESKLKYVDYRLARTKVKKLNNEYLEMPFAGTVYAINEEATKAKMEQQAMTLGFMMVKLHIEEARQSGINVFQGMSIPDAADKEKVFNALNVKKKTEVVMQKMLNLKIEKDMLKEKLGRNFLDLCLTAGEFGVIERDASGKDTYRPIELKNAIFAESSGDPLCLRSPFMGERRMMFKHEIFALFPEMPADKRKLVETMVTYPDNFMDKETYFNVYGLVAIPVYHVQWKAFKPDYNKISPSKNSDVPYFVEISEEEYEKESTQNDIKKGKYQVERKYMQTIYHGWRIGPQGDLYLRLEELPYVIQTIDGGNKYIAQYDYIACLTGAVNGTRVSIFELADDLSEVYNVIRFQINREVSKIKGKAFTYNRAYLPKGKDYKAVMRELVEDGIIDYDTSQDGSLDPQAAKDAISEKDFGASQSLPVLIQLGQDVERAMDLITGVTKTRSGMSRASATATGIQTDVEGSLSMTYDLFYYHQLFASEVCKRLCEKTKINWTYLKQDLPGLLYSDEEEAFLDFIRDMTFDNYNVYVSDGRKEKSIRDVARQYFPQEINASKLRTRDAIEFEMTETLSEALQKLDNAWERIENINQQSASMKDQANAEMQQQTLAMSQQQQQMKNDHDKDMAILKGDIDYRNKLGVEQAKMGAAKQDYVNEAILSDAEFLQQLALQQQQNAATAAQGLQTSPEAE